MRPSSLRLGWFSILAVAALWLAGPVDSARADIDGNAARVSWVYNRGSFRMMQPGVWHEKNPTGDFHFRESARTAQYVDLHDASRQMTVRLYGSTMYWFTPGQKGWNYLYHGRWADPTKQPLNLDRHTGERTRVETERRAFPHLGREFEVLGPESPRYNCIAWAVGVTDQWVWPGDQIQDFDQLYGQYGYRRQAKPDTRLQAGVDKIVLYAKQKADGTWSATHGARQLADGSWSSKLGRLPLIRHLELTDLDGDSYGVPVAVYTRAKRP